MKAARKMMVMVIMFVMIFSVGIIPAEAAAKSPAVKQCETVEKRIKKAYKHVKIVKRTKNNDDRFWSIIEHRKGKKYYVVERIAGTVTNSKKDGRDANGYYISYKRVKGVKAGSKVISYFVYSRSNNYCDDIIARYDVVIKKQKK